MTRKYLEVAVPVPLRRIFHYLPTEGVPITQYLAGTRLWVPFGQRKLVGVILGTTDSVDIPASKIKPAQGLIDTEPVMPDALFKLCLWAASYYQHPIGEVMHTAIPALLRQGEPATGVSQILVNIWKEADLDLLNRATKQRQLLTQLIASKAGLSKRELQEVDVSPATIKALLKRGAVSWQSVSQTSSPRLEQLETGQRLTLNEEQGHALAAIEGLGTHLLFGVTGSGKTEVYLQAIARILALGKQALVLVPEIGLTPQTIQRFKDRFQQGVVALHSGLSDRDRLSAWQDASTGHASVIIGTRSAIFTPMLRPGLIVIDEEHDASFKQQDGFRYSARDLAVMRGQMEQIPIILGSATPSLESLANARSGKYQLHKLLLRPTGAKATQYKIIPTQHQPLLEGFSRSLINLITRHLDENNQVLVFLNRRGFAPVLHCRQCAWMSTCNQCDARLTYHLATRSLNCHHCGSRTRAPAKCPDCQSDQLIPLGLGTQRLETGLQQHFPDERIIRIDRDSTRKKGSMEAIVAEAQAGNRAILLGTQLLAKGHHFPDVTLVAIIDLDGSFYSADYRAIERMGQLLLQVSGRAGREQKPGTVAIQTAFPEQPILHCLINEGYEAFAEILLAERRRYQLPPYHYQAVIRAEAPAKQAAMEYLEKICTSIQQHPSVQVSGPFPSSMERLAGKYRAQLLFSSAERSALQKVLYQAIRSAESNSTSRSLRWSVDVDPYDLY